MPFPSRCRRCVLGTLALPLTTTLQARAQPNPAGNYPRQPIKLVVPYAAGGGLDVFTRRLAEGLGPLLGQTVCVENRVAPRADTGGRRPKALQ